VLAGRRGQGLAIGLTEANASLLGPPGAGPPNSFARSRTLLTALHPDFLRIEVDWSKLQPTPGSALGLSAPNDGCDRGLRPCAVFAGLASELHAIAQQQRAGAGWEPVIVIDGVPAWAAHPPGGCERPSTAPRSRPIAPAALNSYRGLIAALVALGVREGVALHWWDAWNEPNHPFFISPQRQGCDSHAAALSPAVYATLVRAMRDELRALGGDRRLVLGDLAGYVKPPGPRAVSVSEFIADLPQDVICAGSAWAVHDYGTRYADPAAALAPVHELERALDRRGSCGGAAHVWITETGAGGPNPRSIVRDTRAACRRLATAMAAWNADHRIDAAFQYTFREDPAFRVGLADPTLQTVSPAYYEWLAWGARRPSDPAPPPLASQCAGA
jgi:hypothetical protein